MRASTLAAVASGSIAVALALAVGSAAASTAPAPPATTVAVAYADGVATAPDGSFSAAFAATPAYTPSTDGLPEQFHADVDEDGQEVARFGVDAFGAAAETSPTERAELFIAASGTAAEWLANTSTSLGPDPAAHFIARVTLGDGRPAVVYGLVVVTPSRVTYVFATDVGGDDADRSRQFVSSYTSLLPSPIPVAPTTTTTTTTTTTPSAATATITPSLATLPPTTAPATTTDPSTTAPATTGAAGTTAVATTVSPIPVGAVASPDGAWWVRFPEDAEITATASTDEGFAYLEYRADVAGDVLTARAVEIPEGFEWDESTVPGFPTATADAESATIDGSPAAASTFDDGDATVTALVVDTGTRLVAVTYRDHGNDDTETAADFVGSLGLAR